MRTVIRRVRTAHDASGEIDIELAGGTITAIVPQGAAHASDAPSRVIEGEGLTAVPGFIDIHVHGARGADFMDASEEAFRTIGEYHASGGTTSYLPSTATDAPEAILACIDMAARCREQRIGSVEILGVHVEGPYMGPNKHGCHDPGFVRKPTPAENRAYLDRAPIIKRITCAREVPGVQSFISEMNKVGIIASGGHSEATLDETRRAIDNGIRDAGADADRRADVPRRPGVRQPRVHAPHGRPADPSVGQRRAEHAAHTRREGLPSAELTRLARGPERSIRHDLSQHAR
jgi:N-acetylglucosamine-6-phosphate deacetylase